MTRRSLKVGMIRNPGAAAAVVAATLMTLLPGIAHAQTPTIKATVGRTALAVNDTVDFNVEVTTSGSIAEPSEPSLDGLLLVSGPSPSMFLITLNEKTSAQLVHRYRLQPTKTGKVTIGSVSVVVDGQMYRTDPITLSVSQGGTNVQPIPDPVVQTPSAPRLTGQDFFVDAIVDNPNPYVGEQVIYTFRFYSTESFLSFDRPRYIRPDSIRFRGGQTPYGNTYHIQEGGRRYQVNERQSILFPVVAGPAEIGPAKLTIPGNLLQRGQVLETNPVALAVKPLPVGAPGGFTGAVGRFTIESEIDSTSARVNEPLTLTVRIKGEGALDTLPDPVWPDMPRWRIFEQGASTQSGRVNSRIAGSREYERLMIPAAPGSYTIPPISYTFFDPEREDYVTASTQAIRVSVEPGDTESPLVPLPNAAKEGVQRFATDIRHIKPAPAVLQTESRPLNEQGLYWVAWALPLIALAAGVGLKWTARRQEGDPSVARSLIASRTARHTIDYARNSDTNPYEAAGRALVGYLSDRLDVTVTGMTRDRLGEILASRGVGPELIGRVESSLTSAEGGRYAPGGADATGGELLDETEALIADLDEDLGT